MEPNAPSKKKPKLFHQPRVARYTRPEQRRPMQQRALERHRQSADLHADMYHHQVIANQETIVAARQGLRDTQRNIRELRRRQQANPQQFETSAWFGPEQLMEGLNTLDRYKLQAERAHKRLQEYSQKFIDMDAYATWWNDYHPNPHDWNPRMGPPPPPPAGMA